MSQLQKSNLLRLPRRCTPRNDRKDAICLCERREAIPLLNTFAITSSYKKLYEDCINGERYCKDEERVVINLHEKNGKCLQVTNSAIDCEGKATLGVDLREFLGILKIEYNSMKEVWLLWNAPGYEGDGIYAIEINDISNKNRLLEEWLVYNGC